MSGRGFSPSGTEAARAGEATSAGGGDGPRERGTPIRVRMGRRRMGFGPAKSSSGDGSDGRRGGAGPRTVGGERISVRSPLVAGPPAQPLDVRSAAGAGGPRAARE